MDKKAFTDANRLTTLTYMICGCLGYSIENLQKYLQSHNLELKGKDKHYFNLLQQSLKRTTHLLNSLENEALKIMTKDGDDAVLSYEDATHIYWYLFLLLVDRGGTDRLYDLRLQALCAKIERFKSLVGIPGLELAKSMAFAQVVNAIKDHKYTEEDIKNLFQYENRNKTHKRKVSRKDPENRSE